MTDMNRMDWFLDATEMDPRYHIKTIKAVREYSDLGLLEAKRLIDMARSGSVLLPDSFERTKKAVSLLKSFNVMVRTKYGPVTTEEVHESVTLVTEQKINIMLSDCSPGPLMALARFYGIKGRGRMISAQLIHALIPKMSKSESIAPGRVRMLIDEARLISSAW